MLLLLLEGLLAGTVFYIALACIVPATPSLAHALFPPHLLFGFGPSERKKEAANDERGQETRRPQIGKIRPSGLIYESISALVM